MVFLSPKIVRRQPLFFSLHINNFTVSNGTSRGLLSAMPSGAEILPSLQQNTIRYGFPILVALGNFGNLAIILIFTRKSLRQSSCAFYLLCAAVFSLLGVNWGLVTNMYTVYHPPDPFGISLSLCRTRGYILQISSVLYRTMIVLASADRCALSSVNAKIRSFSKPKVAIKMIIITSLFWMIISIHLPIFQTIISGRCSVFGVYGIFFSLYQIFIFGLLLPALMITFGILIQKNLSAIRSRVQPLAGATNIRQPMLNKRDMNLLKVVLAEVTVGFLLSFSYPIQLLYSVLTDSIPNKSQDRIWIETFMTFTARTVLFYLNYCVTFYLYVIVSKSFRQEAKVIVLKCFMRTGQEHVSTINGSITAAH
ncbi:unnamed protein product [Rotaria magnacalcarata]|uniref:G-protein coupled receptors family 1 profile domain-containing protein n=1 Tax=Rotaria magnacalcarata TaxID=392030 RepID=A0A820EUB4_9BILA|nr:unnamed protein product [Rotaria magnacalcarata]CAF1533525.1 unnamed protein product [Rotaria magnacalcarata]CAF2001888.1 unnamed protein product [Rotaria magnacalcarata]CAF2061936.1 unnamed protein product [Rotaria magnacalcarata]CAF2107206.1 unnamed protein product [Rotaria magnacalcarata]